jgi:hypothetical protein
VVEAADAELDVLMLASSPFYASGTFWAGAAVAVAVVAIVVPVVLWFRIAPRRLLIYSLVSETALLASGPRHQVGPDLKVTLSERILHDPHVISLQVESRSRRDIRRTDFEDAAPLMLDLATPILSLLDLDTGGQGMPEVELEIKSTTVAIGPSLIKSGQVIKVDLLTDGPVSVTCPHPQLADVIVKEGRPENKLGPVMEALNAMPVPLLIPTALGGAIGESFYVLIRRIARHR